MALLENTAPQPVFCPNWNDLSILPHDGLMSESHDHCLIVFVFTGPDKGDLEPVESCECIYTHTHLSPNTLPAVSVETPHLCVRWHPVIMCWQGVLCVGTAGKQTPLCYPSTVSSARAIMLFNLGSAYCLRSEYEKARKCLHQVRFILAGTRPHTHSYSTYLSLETIQMCYYPKHDCV